jgi:hypothetical protein
MLAVAIKMIIKYIVIDCLLQKLICLKPSFNIFSIIKRNLGDKLEMQWVLYNCYL